MPSSDCGIRQRAENLQLKAKGETVSLLSRRAIRRSAAKSAPRHYGNFGYCGKLFHVADLCLFFTFSNRHNFGHACIKIGKLVKRADSERKAGIMSKAKSTFRKTDVKRAILAAESAGMKVDRVEIDKEGKISLLPSNGAQTTETATDEITL